LQLQLQTNGIDGAQVGAHRHRRLATLDAMEGDPGHAGRLGGHRGADLLLLAMGAHAFTQST
jgi:hypothetical protein